MESQLWHQLASSVGGRLGKGTMASAYLDARHFSSSLYATSAFQAANLVLELREWVWVGESVFAFFKRNCLGLQQFLPLNQSCLIFVARSCRNLSSWHYNPGLGSLVWVWDSLPMRYPSQIFVYHTWVKDLLIRHLCPSYQSGWVWFLPFCSCQTSIQLNFLLFWVIVILYFSCTFKVVVWGGKPCVPMPSWPEVPEVS